MYNLYVLGSGVAIQIKWSLEQAINFKCHVRKNAASKLG